MPLLKKKSFEKTTEPDFLRDNEQVFYCSMTNEIFRDYEEFCERMLLCNSMVWTCSLTGKSNLTYMEALESEENAKKSLREFPSELKMPILYLASKTKRTSFGDMSDDVFQFAKDRYFIGENVETSFTGSKWKEAHILQVIAPTEDQIKTALKANGELETKAASGTLNQLPPAFLFKYEIEHMDAFDEDISEMMIAEHSQIRRKKGSFSKEKCKLFLKQFVEQDARGVFIIRAKEIENYKINKMTFDQMFDGPEPQFDSSKRLEQPQNHSPVNGKRVKQTSLDGFLSKSQNGHSNGSNEKMLERMKKKEEEMKKVKQQRKEEEIALKLKKKEAKLLISEELKVWYTPKEDLELTDQSKLPQGTPIKTKVPENHLGDMLMVMEFVKSFSKILSTRDFFPNGLTIEIMERALTENEVAGPLIDILQMLLSALFEMQEAEANQYKSQVQNLTLKQLDDINDNNMNVREASRLATYAALWSLKHQGLSIGKLPLYSLTTSEILRLHLLSSGAIINSTGTKWRYQQRGGYLNEDDPGLYLRLHQPQILKSLSSHNVVELPIADKLQILSCLINQLLTYADVRDIVEEQIENKRQAKNDSKALATAEKKRTQKYSAAKAKLNKEDMAKDSRQYSLELNKIEAETEKEKLENLRKQEEIQQNCYHQQIILGQDRAYRQYIKLESVPGLFINWEEQNPGQCLPAVVKQNPALIKGDRDATKSHIVQMLEESLENEASENDKAKLIQKKLNNGPNFVLNNNDELDELLMCAANEKNCIVHSIKRKKPKWTFFQDVDQLNNLIGSLNCRGIRENLLLEALNNQKVFLEDLINNTPTNSLNDDAAQANAKSAQSRRSLKTKYDDANLGYPDEMAIDDILLNVLIENILEIEEKIFAGGLGEIHIKDREKWRNDLQNKHFKELDKTLNNEDALSNPLVNVIKKDEDSRPSTPSSDTSEEKYLPSTAYAVLSSNEDHLDNNEILCSQSAKHERSEAIRTLSIALAQVGQSVHRKYLKKPLGRIGTKNTDNKFLLGLIGQWEKSLLASTSFSQIFLHYSTLDSCVLWSRSVLVARCRICRRQTDSENMLLCDSCNLGHHLYCLKPKLKTVPAGDWFCDKCQQERKRKSEPPPQETPAKKRPIFRDEEIDDEEQSNNEDDDNESMDESNNGDEMGEEEEDNNEENMSDSSLKCDLCKRCGSGGELITCEKCANNFHIECTEPPLRRIPRGLWSCSDCKKNNDRKRSNDRSYQNGKVVQRTAVLNGQRRCAAKALYKIHDFAKSLRHLSETDDSSEDEVIKTRSSRREEGRSDLPLHNAALHEVLSEIMKDGNCWPFLRPVQKNEVPDYYDVITKPMDFGTIKYKLNMGEYTEDAHFMSDALLVFQNCNTYNHTEDDVYKCGVQLLKHFQRKCRELGLKLPELMDYNDESRPRKKLRTK